MYTHGQWGFLTNKYNYNTCLFILTQIFSKQTKYFCSFGGTIFNFLLHLQELMCAKSILFFILVLN